MIRAWVNAVVVVALSACVLGGAARCTAADLSINAGDEVRPSSSLKDLPKLKSISQYGITWTLDKEVSVGQFITGDYYVVGPVTVTAISPAPEGGRNGSMLNPPVTAKTAYDDRLRSHDAKLAVKLPVKMKPGDSLVSTISHEARGHKHIYPHREKSSSVLKTAAVLTCLAKAASADTFRPSYCGSKDKLYRYADLDLSLLPSLKRAKSTPKLALYERIFQRPWIDHTYTWLGRMTHPTENMPDYGREISRAVSEASLLLMCDFKPSEKKKLLTGLVQYGIDLWGVARAGGGWRANGGHASGRKWPILFAGILLKDKAMQKPKAEFGEDMQTYYGKGYYGAKVLFRVVRRSGLRGEHEHLPPSEYPDKMMPEGYRRCCTALSWVGTALSARMMHAEEVWDHAAYFDYVDRWMTEDDAKQLADIKAHYGKAPRVKQGETWSKFVTEMWQTYRKKLPPVKK